MPDILVMRAVAALLAAARRHDPERPPDAQGLDDLDVPADDWLAALKLAPPRREAAAVLGLRVRVGEAGQRAHTALRRPSFMDGAVESGHRVAAEIGPGE